MGSLKKVPLFILVVRLIVSATFLWAAFPKIKDPLAFSVAIEGFRVLGSEYSLWVAIVLPWLEVVIGFGLLIPYLRRASGSTISILLVAFIGLHISAWSRGLDISCGCFGASEEESNYAWLILRNILLLGSTICIILHDFRKSRAKHNFQKINSK